MSVTERIQCSVTGCPATRSRTITPDNVGTDFRPFGWRSENGIDLCPGHVHASDLATGGFVAASIPPGHADPIPVVSGGGGGAGGGRRAVADSIRVVELSREIRDARQLIPADILDGGDLVDGVRRLAAEHQRVTAAHAQAADARDLLQAQKDELRAEYDRRRDSAGLFAQVYDALLPTTPGLLTGQVPAIVRERLSQVAEVRHERDAYLHQRDRAWGHLDAIRDSITQFGQEKLRRDQLPEAVKHLNIGYDRLQEIHRDTREQLDSMDRQMGVEVEAVRSYRRVLNKICNELPDPADVTFEQLPNLVRSIVADRDLCASERDKVTQQLTEARQAHRDLDAARAAKDLPPYSYREGFGNPPVDDVVSAVAAQLVPAVLAEFEKRGVPGSAFGFPSRYSVPATPPLTIWSDNGGEAFIPHTEDGTLTNTDAAHGTPAQTGQEDAAEVPDCDRSERVLAGQFDVHGRGHVAMGDVTWVCNGADEDSACPVCCPAGGLASVDVVFIGSEDQAGEVADRG